MTRDSDFTLDPRLARSSRGEDTRPGWAYGLRHLYRGVVNEPIPTDFRDMLSQLNRLG